MIRLLLIVLGGWAAWRYRGQIKGYVEEQLPHMRTRAAEMLGDAKEGIGRRSPSAGRRVGQAEQ